MKLSLEKFTEADIGPLIAQIPDRRFLAQWAGTSFQWPLDERQLRDHIEKALSPETCMRVYKAVDARGKTLGHGEFTQIDSKNRSATLSRILIFSSFRGQGLGREMVKQLLETGFSGMNLHRISLHVFDFNETAILCYKSLGFQKEGLLRHARKVNDEYWNIIVMSILKTEFLPDRG